MRQYESAAIPEYLSVKAIVAALTKPFANTSPAIGVAYGEAHDFPELFYVRDGTHDMFVGGEIYSLARGQMMIYAPLNLHYGAGGGEATCSVLSFKADFGTLPGIYNRVITLSQEQREALNALVDEASSCYVSRSAGSEIGGMLLRDGISEYRIQKLKRDLELFLIDIYRTEGLLGARPKPGKKTARHEQFTEIINMLRTRLGEELTVEDIARASSMSVSKLKQLFRECTGGGPINYFIDMKLEKAKELIRMGYYNLTETAEALGFSSLHYFSRLFKARVGLSPSDWARSIEEEEGR